jgi:UDP:flavonoid glycosyltransferase YjiC (YdhE family)
MAGIVFLTLDGGGNVAPALAIARELAASGHRVRFLADQRQVVRLGAEGFDATAYRHAAGWHPADPTSSLAGILSFSRMLADRGYAQDLADALRVEPADVVVLDGLLPGTVAPAKALGIPVVVLLHTFAQFFLRSPGVRAAGALHGLRPAREWGRADAVLVATDHELDPAGRTHVPGSFHWTGVAEELPHAAAPASITDRTVLLSLSTVAAPGQHRVLQNALDAVASLPIAVIATTGPTLDPAAFRAGANTRLLASAPHAEILPSCSAVIGHGGHSTTMRALIHGLPLVIVPCDTRIDQPLVAGVVARAGAGIALPKKAAPERIRAALTTVLDDPTYRETAGRIGRRLREQRGAAHAAEAVVAAARRAAPV